MLKIALVGAPGTGKSQLATNLSEALKVFGWPAVIVLIDTHALQSGLASHSLILLMGLDAQSSTRLAQEAADQKIRTTLAHANLAYRVIYGFSEERLHHALQACASVLKQTAQSPDSTKPSPTSASVESVKKARPWVWMCDKCSDPACEHRLLGDLLASRAADS